MQGIFRDQEIGKKNHQENEKGEENVYSSSEISQLTF